MGRLARCSGVALALALFAWPFAGRVSTAADDGRAAGPAGPTEGRRWSFGVIADTQWTEADDGRNPGTCAVDIVNQVNEEFVRHRVKFVVALGDLTDAGGSAHTKIRAVYAQALYNAGIGFFPLRGNHDVLAPDEFRRVFPQTQTGLNNSTPADAFAVPNPDIVAVPPPPVQGRGFTVGTSFSSPVEMPGLSYSFDYGNARLVLLDQFDGRTNTIQPQMRWIAGALSGRPPGSHAIVFGHKGLLTEYHGDNLFGGSPDADPAGTDAFIKSLAENGVRYYVGGHDHMHDLTEVFTNDGVTAKVTELVCASDSSKFYVPRRHGWRRWVPGFLVPASGRVRQIPLAQEIRRVGYYVFTVEGPRLTVDYYSAPVHLRLVDGDWTLATTPRLVFSKRQTFGYDLNGREFLVGQGASYAVVDDSFEGMRARILDGVNGSARKDAIGRPFSHAVNTGWSPRQCGAASPGLHLWGMATAMGSERTDVFTLSLGYDERHAEPAPAAGTFGVEAKDSAGSWRNAVDLNSGAGQAFVAGPWRPGFGLGTYGIDPLTRTAWAVVDYDGEFRVGYFDVIVTEHRCQAEGRH